jgi:predicted HicB family RNase H-like nuclease
MEEESDSPDPQPRKQFSVRLPEELVKRVGIAAAGAGKSLTQFVQETLDERTKEHKDDAARIIEREKTPKYWK